MRKFLLFLVLFCSCLSMQAWRGMRMPELFINGRYLMAKDVNGNDSIVNLHGFGQTYSPYFNGYAWCKDSNGNVKWDWNSQHDASKCVTWNKNQISGMLNKGWKVNWIRIHMDPHWSNGQGKQQTNGGGESDITAFDFEMFKTNFDKVFYKMAEYSISQGIYVVMRPPGVCPQNLKIGDDYQKYLIKVWKYVASLDKVKNNPHIMFELANEPVNMWDGSQYTNGWTDGSLKNHTAYFQTIVDSIRALGCNNILWVPGLCWQQNYQGFVKYPITGENIGLAVHCYPGWYGSDSEADNGSVEQGIVTKGNTYADFQAGWTSSLGQASQKYPILVTEMDWSPKSIGFSWGKCNTGTLGGTGFGANFRYIMDKTGNVSWMLFTDADKLAQYDDALEYSDTYLQEAAKYSDGSAKNTEWKLKAFLTSEDACPRPVFRWYQEYANPDWKFEDTLSDELFYFPGTDAIFNASIWETGTLTKNEDGTHTLITGQYGFGGWKFSDGLDMSSYKYLVLNLAKAPSSSAGWSLRLFDENNYWGKPSMTTVGTKTRVVVAVNNLKNSSGVKINPSHIYILGLWSNGGSPIVIKSIYLTNNSDFSEETGIDEVENEERKEDCGKCIYNIQGIKVSEMKKGQMYIQNGKKIINK